MRKCGRASARLPPLSLPGQSQERTVGRRMKKTGERSFRGACREICRSWCQCGRGRHSPGPPHPRAWARARAGGRKGRRKGEVRANVNIVCPSVPSPPSPIHKCLPDSSPSRPSCASPTPCRPATEPKPGRSPPSLPVQKQRGKGMMSTSLHSLLPPLSPPYRC